MSNYDVTLYAEATLGDFELECPRLFLATPDLWKRFEAAFRSYADTFKLVTFLTGDKCHSFDTTGRKTYAFQVSDQPIERSLTWQTLVDLIVTAISLGEEFTIHDDTPLDRCTEAELPEGCEVTNDVYGRFYKIDGRTYQGFQSIYETIGNSEF